MSRLTALFAVMTMFWAAIVALSWFVQRLYIPFTKVTIESGLGPVLGSVVTWLIIVIIIMFMLLGFRNLLRRLFWRTIGNVSRTRE